MPNAAAPFSAHLSLTVMLGRMALSVACGALLGWERQRVHKPAGLRTHMLVSLGSAAFMLASFEIILAGGVLAGGATRWDPTRVIQGIIQGIGFLGAGEIIHSRGKIQGMTTAAGIWVASCIGVCCGMGLTSLALALTAMAFLIQVAAWRLERRFFSGQPGDASEIASERAPAPVLRKPRRD